ncbi:hypothetical protein [Bradyrhizobium valentinum]|uniref:hypothetical protein n=1 Tax=Bradyrhizobium valentinum TaxID=1518501 RepID=UPI001FDA441D|nr:hypothetical protein [Bradyrhizobium valentinum]
MRTIDYIGSSDNSLSGSRNAYTPIVFWYAIRSLALQLPFLSASESMGNHDSNIVDAGSVD